MTDWTRAISYRDEYQEPRALVRAATLEELRQRYAPAPEAAQWYYDSPEPCPVCGEHERAVNGLGECWCRNCLTLVPARLDADADKPT